jgi:multidrug resistance efflux pump
MSDVPQPQQTPADGDGASAEASGAEAPDTEAPSGRKDPVRLVTLIVLAICIVVFIWYVRADRLTPYTSQARVQALVVPIVPRVSGHVTEVGVRLHSSVEKDDVLFQLDRRPFELAVDSAEAQFDQATQQLGVQGATVKSAAGRLGVARAQLDRAQRSYNRTQLILDDNPGALSLADKDRSETSLAQAVERLTSAEADLEKAQQQLGIEGPDNAQIRLAIAAVEQAHLDLEFTTVQAPSRGAIENFNVDVGHYAQSGQPLATFVSSHDVWIQADMRENNLGHIEPGDPVEFVLDAAPGRVFEGKVRSVGYGVSSGPASNRGDLPSVGTSKGWLRDPQRFPVIVDLDEEATRGLLRIGGQVDVIVYTGERTLLNPLGKLSIRVRSWLSYVR